MFVLQGRLIFPVRIDKVNEGLDRRLLRPNNLKGGFISLVPIDHKPINLLRPQELENIGDM